MTDDRSALQRRVIGTLVSTQILGGVGLAAGLAVGTLLAQDVSGSTADAGFGGTFQVLGGALLAIPMARIMAARGRRPGLIFGYACALLGAIGLITSAVTRNFPLLLAASVLFGGASASNSQAGYAAADLAEPHRRGRDLSLVIWATTVGTVLGPNLVGPSEPLARALGIPVLAGPYAFSCVGLVLAIVVAHIFLRPDPLLEARVLAVDHDDPRTPNHGSVSRGLRVTRTHPDAMLGMLTMALGHAVMVAVMVMTPVHMQMGHADLKIIGLVLSVHVTGMYALSPLVGLGTDRFGGRAMALLGSLILGAATLLAALSAEGASALLAVALFLLGVGWSCTLVSGQTLLTNAIPQAERPGAQGASTLAMGLAGSGAGALSGVIVEHFGYPALALGALVIAAGVALAVPLTRHRQPALAD